MKCRHRLPPGVSRFILIWGGLLVIVALFITYFVTGGTQNSPLRADDQQPKGKKNRVVLAVNSVTITGTTLQINVGADGSQQVIANGQTSGQFYSAAMPLGDYGVFVATGSTLYGPDFGQHPLSGYGNGAYPVPFTKVSQSGVTGSGTAASPYMVTTVLGAGPLTITQKISYINGQSYYRQDWTVKNTSTSPVTYRLYHAGDMEMPGSNNGSGYYNAQFGAVGAKNQAGNWYILFQPNSAADAYMEANYATIWSSIGNGVPGAGFNNTIITTSTDNGAGLQWNRTLAAAASDTISTFTTLGTTPQFAPSLAANPVSGVRGTIFKITGAGFGASETVLLTVKDQNSTTVAGPTSLTADASGNITTSFTGSLSTMPGTYTASVTGNTSGRSATNSFTVIQDTALTVTPANGVPGTTFKLAGTKFNASETVTLTIKGPNGSTAFGPSGQQATATGGVTFIYTTTAASATGTYTATATGASSGLNAVTTFNLSSNTTLAAHPATGAPGAVFQLSGTGFGISEPVTMSITSPNGSSQNTVLSVRAPNASDPTGNFTYTYTTTISSATGTYTATATGATSGRVASTTLKLVAATAMTVTPKSSMQGSSFQLSGTGYAANEAINLVIAGPGGTTKTVPLAIQPKNSDASGHFTYTYTTTNTAATGVYTATATGVTSGRGASTTFTVTAAPVQQLPALASDPPSGVRGTTFQISGTNFGANETVNFVVETGDGTTTGPFARSSDASGNVRYNYVSTGPTPTGVYTVTATSTISSRSAKTSFSVVAAGAIAVSPASEVAGTTFVISGYGFASNESVNLTITAPNGSSQNSTLAITPRSTNASGNFTYTYATSTTSATGIYTVTAQGAASGSKASINFTVTAPTQQPPPPASTNVTLGVSPVSAVAGATFTLTGQAFGAGEAVNLSFTLPGGSVQNIAAVADASGNFTAKYDTSASSPAGTYTVVAAGTTSHRSATIAFTVSGVSVSASTNVTLGVNPSAGITGTVFTLTGANYGANETVRLNITVPGGAAQTLSATTDAGGNFSVDYTTTASSPEGTYVVVATGQTSNRAATVSFVVGALPPASVPEPTTIALVGSGLAALAAYARKRRASR